MKAFAAAVAHVFEIEKGFVLSPVDHGGPTNFGITLATLAAHRGHPVSGLDIQNLTKPEAEAIYLTQFWQPYGLDYLVSPMVATVVFDQVVNRGPRIAVRALQSVLQSTWAPSLGVDGVLGETTALAANQAPERLLTIKLITEAQRGYLDIWKADPTQGVFVRGWVSRTWRLLDLVTV